jgi:hypothetical protein
MPDPTTCPCCEGRLTFVAEHGPLRWFLCSNCGTDVSVKTPSYDDWLKKADSTMRGIADWLHVPTEED